MSNNNLALNREEKEDKKPDTKEQYIVAIGASAGGLEAIHEFFDNLPSDTGFSFIVIQHLSPDHKSLITELLSKHTKMKVMESNHDIAIEPNSVYVIPSKKLMTIRDRKLQLADKIPNHEPNKTIDIFLNSLAADAGDKAVAVILSGTGSDGTAGIRSIKAAGGLVMIQEPLSAKFNGMPNNAITSGMADFILTPELMPEEIISYARNPEIYKTFKTFFTEEDEKLMPEIFSLINQVTAIDFNEYKRPTILRRLIRRMSYKNIDTLQDYLTHLKEHPDEVNMLSKDFLIGVTKFFRDQEAFESLKRNVIPAIVDQKPEKEPIKIWIPGCSSGEEAYSIAILLDEYLTQHDKKFPVKIFATDIDKEALETASKGCYSEKSLSHISAERIQKYFTKEGDKFKVSPQIRKVVIFACHDLLKDPPFSKMDLVSCRNLLIYLNTTLQKKALSVFHFSLNVKGFLFLGPSENLGELQSSFLEVDRKWKVYQNLEVARLNYSDRLTFNDYPYYTPIPLAKRGKVNTYAEAFLEAAWEEYGFAGIYVDENFRILEAIGEFKKYISLPEKRLDLNLLKMVPEDLSVNLMTAIRKVLKKNEKVVLNDLKLKQEDMIRYISIIVKPMNADTVEKRSVLLLFNEQRQYTSVPSANDFLADGADLKKFRELEEELLETKQNLQNAIEEVETSNEELQSSNEELISSNEELQSTNEELQSLNEELHTVNTEHQLKIKELSELNEDLNNYFRSTDIGQVFLDKNLTIRKFTSAVTHQINLIETDIGRPIHHISNNIKYKGLIEDLYRVLDSGEKLEKEVQVRSGKWFRMKVIPYLKFNNAVDGLILNFIDIDHLRSLNYIISGVLNSSQNSIMAFKAVREDHSIVDFEWLLLNKAAEKLLDKNSISLIGKKVLADTKEKIHQELFEQYVKVVDENETLYLEYKWEENEVNGWHTVMASKMDDGFVITLADVTSNKLAEEEIRVAYHELKNAQEKLKLLNSELEERVRERTRELSISEERFRLISKATNDAIWDWDLSNNDLWWNEGFITLFGHQNTIPSIQTWYDKIHPEDLARVQHGIEEVITKGLKQWSDEYRFLKADGSYANILDRGYALQDENGKTYRMLGSMLDLTKLRIVEEQLKDANKELLHINNQFKFVTDFMPQLVWSTTPDGNHDFFNQQWYEYTGLSEEESINHGWSLILHPDDYERTLEKWQNSLKTGDTYQIEYRFKKHDGSYRWFLGRAVPLISESGTILKWFGTCTDIHDQKINLDNLAKTKEQLHFINIELSQKNEELMKINNDLDNFIYTASHDLKAPVSNIEGLVLTLDGEIENKTESVTFIVQLIKDSIERFKNTIKDLTEITKIQKNIAEDIDELVLKDVIKDVMSSIRDVVEKTHAKVLVETQEVPEIRFSRKNLKSILYNLISNGIKYHSPERTPQIKVRTYKDKEYNVLSVSDNGLGIPPDKKDKIFGMFKRFHDHVEGTGVGLYIVKRIIDNAGGKIEVESKVGEGTTIKVLFPSKDY